MKIEVEVSDEMGDSIILESLKLNLECLLEETQFPYSDDENEVIELRAAFKLVLDYYGG
jgi:hypothetical protein